MYLGPGSGLGFFLRALSSPARTGPGPTNDQVSHILVDMPVPNICTMLTLELVRKSTYFLSHHYHLQQHATPHLHYHR